MFGKLKNELKSLSSFSYLNEYKIRLKQQLNLYLLLLPKQAQQREEDKLWLAQHDSSVPTLICIPYETCPSMTLFSSLNEEILLFHSSQGELAADAEVTVRRFFSENPQFDFAYGNEDCEGSRSPWYKQEWSPETLLSYFYIGSFFAVKRSLLLKTELPVSSSYEEWIYELVLRLTSHAKVGYMDRILYHRSSKADYMCEAACANNPEAFCPGSGTRFTPIKEHVQKKQSENALVSILIPSKDNPSVLETCIRSIQEHTGKELYEIIVVDNGSREDNRIRVTELSEEYGFSYYYVPMEFHFSKMCNIAAQKANGNYFLLLNDDIEICQDGWLEKMIEQAALPQIGAVGAKLLYPHSTLIQHVGVSSTASGPSHILVQKDDRDVHCYGRNRMVLNVLAVTGACMMVRKELYVQLNGLSEEFPISYNDIDFCIRLHKLGFRNIQRNDIVLYHHESLSRGYDAEDTAKSRRLSEECRKLYRIHPEFCEYDPYYNRLYAATDCRRVLFTPIDRKEWLPLSVADSHAVFSIDTAKEDLSSVRETPTYYIIEGWGFLSSLPNCRYSKSLLLENGSFLYELPTVEILRNDVAKNFANEAQIELSGLFSRFPIHSIQPGDYHIRICFTDLKTGKRLYGKSDTLLTIPVSSD